MACPQCGEEVGREQKFCANCGSALAPACANCGAQLTGRERFCPECGTATAPSARAGSPSGDVPGEPRRERRLVSVLFADLVGFTAASEDRDPEQTRDFQERYFALCREVIARYGGTVEKFIGDAVMAVWGAPTAHEDDAERAVRAALDLVEAVITLPGTARAAVVTGDAAVAIGAEGHGLVSGDIVNTCARLQGVAEPGAVLVSESAQRAASSAIEFEDVGEQQVRGKALPVHAWRAVRVVGGGRGSRHTGELEPPFVGRDAELSLVKELFHAVSRERRLRVVSVTGQAGIGKSRLVWEFEKYLDGIVENVRWHHGRSPAYGDGVTFWALGEIVRQRAEIAETDDAESTRQKLAAAVATHVPTESERERIEAALLVLLGLEERGVAPQELFAAWRAFFEHVARDQVTVLVFEDLHWADTGLLDFLEHVFEWSRNHALLIVTLARPELLDRRPTWGAGQRNFTAFHLEPLGPAPMREMLTAVVPDMPRPAVQAIVQRAEGVPLYAVELLRVLIADGTLLRAEDGYRLTRPLTALEIPDSLQAVVAARLDTLDLEDRAVLQHAAVLGQSFTVDALTAVTGRDRVDVESALTRLARRELLRLEDDPRSPERGQHQFVQSVIREVAYSTLARRDRAGRHVAAARYYEALGDDELAGVLATHYVEAFHASEGSAGADALAAQARVALRAAAERATVLHANDQAVAFLVRAIDVTADAPERATLRLRAGEAAWRAGRVNDARELLAAAIDEHRAVGDVSGVALATARLGASFLDEGQVDEALALLTSAVEDVGTEAAPVDRAWLIGQLARAHFLKHDEERALVVCEQALAIAEREGLVSVVLDTLVTKSALLSYHRPLEGIALMRGAIDLADRYALPESGLRCRNNLALALAEFDPAAAVALAEEAAEISRRLGLRGSLIGAVAGAAGHLLDRGEVERSAALLEEFRDEDLENTQRLMIDWDVAYLSALRGDDDSLATVMSRRERAVAELSNPEWLSGDRMNRAFVALIRGELDDAATNALRAVEHFPDVSWPRSLRGLIALWRRERDVVLEAIAGVEGTMARTPRSLADLARLRAGLAALDGEVGAAVLGYAAVNEAWRDLEVWIERVVTAATFVSLLGTGTPELAAAERDARQLATSRNARGLVDMLDRALAMPPVVTASLGSDAARAEAVLRVPGASVPEGTR
jgi:class 3 adenylate cyclase/tetratricopeptide (TPR) repeat protein